MKNYPIQTELFHAKDYPALDNWFTQALAHFNIENKPGWPDSFGNSLREWTVGQKKVKPVRVLSLFSGAGGLDIGFHDAGFDIVESNELEKDFVATLLENSSEGKRLEGTNVVCADISDYFPKLKSIDFIIGGPPCQTFSAAGARAAGVNGLDDDRGNLFREYVRLLQTLQPKGFLFENVYRIVGAQGGEPWKLIQKEFRDAGYALHWRILDAADYGVPQFRERLIIVGLKNGEYKFPFPSHGPDSQNACGYYSSGFATSSTKSQVAGNVLGGRHGHFLNDIPPGLNYSFYTEKLGHPKPVFGWRSKFSDYLYKADPETPVRTIKAQGGQYTGPFHWENRTFTIEELKRLQTFPDDYKIVGNRQKAIHQLGNSVPPQFARVLAASIKEQMFGQSYPFYIPLMEDSYKLNFRARKSTLSKIYAQKASDAIAKLGIIEHPLPSNIIGKMYGFLSSDLNLIVSEDDSSSTYVFSYSINDKSWEIGMRRGNATKSEKFFTIEAVRTSQLVGKVQIEKLSMFSCIDDINAPLVLWKFFEFLIKKYLYKDDIVQLFGYYQYKQNYTCTVEFEDCSLEDEDFWKVFRDVTQGHCVRISIDIEDLALEYDMPTKRLMKCLRLLKNIGFEIRNSNTNKQIKIDSVLIPYSFPSLSERSLQRFTEL